METMGCFSEEECDFFDACEDIVSVLDDAKSDSPEMLDSGSGFDHSVPSSLHDGVWVKSPRSVRERRSTFLCWMGEGIEGNENMEGVFDRVREDSGAVLRKYGCEDEFCSTRSIMSRWSDDYSRSSEGFVCRDGTSDGGVMQIFDEVPNEGSFSEGCELGMEQLGTANENTSSTLSQQLVQEGLAESIGTPRRFKSWLSRLRSFTCSIDMQREDEKFRNNEGDEMLYKMRRVKVHQNGKKMKELSALYINQNIRAHERAILTMKFSPDGWYLASAGMDKIVRVWQILEDERSNKLDIPEIDPSCIYFTVSHLSQLKPLFLDKEKATKVKSMRKTSDSACVIFPPTVFRILEKPLHEFHGHTREILDLSWSTSTYLLSASVDQTVRLWRVGCDQCLKVFSHSNYVTCVQFNPVDENYFISGSIDGKVRIWSISSGQVVDWTVVKDIVTAVCYRPDGQGGIIGTMEGNCRFYSMSDDHLELNAQICLTNKKKSTSKRITGFQFSPEDSTKVIVTSADSNVRVLDGHHVVLKYKGARAAPNQIAATFTSDGRHIISASEDSNVYIWNCINQWDTPPVQVKSIRSCEHFSANASIAIPWSGFRSRNSENGCSFHVAGYSSPEVLRSYSPASFSLSQEYVLESFPKGSATWPEEKLPASSQSTTSSSIHRSQYNFLKASCQNTGTSHAWDLVIVTAGPDGRIRSFHNYGLPVSV